MIQTFTSTTIEETQQIAADIMPLVLKSKIVALSGDLGSGKTLLCSYVIKELCNDAGLMVTSPTFNILKTYKSDNFGLIHHYDLYRLKNPAEIEEIGLAELLNAKSSICLIEWPEVISSMLSRDVLYINIKHVENTRTIVVIVN
jgi:tRNA threonylcarbamoyl adenosine modification protein YjeE